MGTVNQLPDINSTIELTATDQPYGPDAFGRLDGLAVFLDGAVAGDVVKACVTEQNKRFIRATVTEIVTPSPVRVEAFCPYADRCGGCQWQCTGYETQLEAKRNAVQAALERIGRWEDIDVEDVVPSPVTGPHRNKANYAISGGRGGIAVGYHARATHDVVDVDSCPLNLPEMDAVLTAATRVLKSDAMSQQANRITGIGARQSAATGNVILRLVTRGNCASFVEAVQAETDPQVLAGITVASGRGSRARERALIGEHTLTEQVGTITYRASAESFFQVNPYVTPLLVEHVAELAALTGSEHVIDAYGGAGLFTVALAPHAGRIDLVESARSSVRDAEHTLAQCGIKNCRTHAKSVEQVASIAKGADVVICDPPREGMSKRAADALLSMKADRFIYVSCDPSNLARDSKLLRDAGYALTHIRPFDMFPHTYHVETVALFEKSER